MEKQLQHLRHFLETRQRVLNWRGMEIEAGLPKHAIKGFMLAGRALDPEEIQKIIPVLRLLGYADEF